MLPRTPQTIPQIAPLPPGTERPFWSIMIPVFNCIQYLPLTLKSVLDQFEGADRMQIEVIDDFSTDGDVEALVKEIGQGRVHYHRQPQNVGSLRNFETCINRARGQVVHILHGDDVSMDGYYKKVAQAFADFPEAGAVFTHFTHINDLGEVLWDAAYERETTGILENWPLRLAEGQKVQPPAISVKRMVYEKIGSFYAVHYGEDWEMWMRIAANFPVAYIPETLAKYRVHYQNITGRSYVSGQNIRDISKVIDLIQAYLPPEHRQRLRSNARKHFAEYYTWISHKIYHDLKKRRAAARHAYMVFRLHPNRFTLNEFMKIVGKIVVLYRM